MAGSGPATVPRCDVTDARPPAWVSAPAATGRWRELTVPAPMIGATVPVSIWSPALPARGVLLAHDGPDYERRACLSRYSAAMVAAGEVAPHHVVLLDPGERNEWYSVNPGYARALVREVLPAVRAEVGRGPVVGMGASLGGLALLAAQRRYPSTFAGLFLQSGSFFQRRYDPQESGFPWYRRIVRFVGGLSRAAPVRRSVPIVLTCGTGEENLANNRDMARILRRLGYPVTLHEVPGGHDFTAWRDALDPALTRLLRTVWGDAG